MFNEYSKQLDYCSYCPRLCLSACPIATQTGNTSFSPWGLMNTLNLVRKNEIPFDQDVVDLSYQCLTCMACTAQCEHGIEIPPILHEARKLAVEKEMVPKSIASFSLKFHKHNNPYSNDLLYKLKQLVPKKYFDLESSVVYFPSCTTIEKTPEVIKDTFELFEKLKIDFVTVYPEVTQCCGYPLYVGGMEEDFVDVAEINFHSLKKYKTIITGSPTCVYTLRETYKKYDFDLGTRVLSINEFLEPYLSDINFRIKRNIKTKLMYHDPCYSARYLNEIERPREMLAQVSGYEPVEFFQNKYQCSCSGQGGCYPITDRNTSKSIAMKRLEEVYEKKVQTLITQCPTCLVNFRKYSKQLTVQDLISYLNNCIEGVKES